MKSANKYTEAVANAITFSHDNPSEKQVTSAQIYHVNANTIRSKLWRERQYTSIPPKQHGGQNKILSEAQITAIYKYVKDLYLSGYGVTKSMVFVAIRHLKVSQDQCCQ